MEKMKIRTAPEKNEIYLTLSARLVDNNSTGIVERIEELQRVMEPKDPAVMKYESGWLHFSMVNFYTRKLNNDTLTFPEARNEIENSEWIDEFRDFSSREILKKHFQKERKFYMGRVFRKDDGTWGGRLAVNLFAEDASFTGVAESIHKEGLEKIVQLEPKGFKAEYRPDNMNKVYSKGEPPHVAVNMFALIGGENDTPLQERLTAEMSDRVEQIDKDIQTEKFPFVLEKPVLVISDAYLSNLDPVILSA
jgi:hypothetical protein